MNVILYGKGILAEKVYQYLIKTDALALGGVCSDAVKDADVIFAEDVKERTQSIPLIDRFTAARAYEEGIIDAVILATDNAWLSTAVSRLSSLGIQQLCYLPYYYEEAGREIRDESFVWVDIQKPRMEYIEYHISYQCNLKCKGCTHFSNLVNRPWYGDYEQFCADLCRLQELFWGIYKIRLMGGEPLLHPELGKYIVAARETFPDADIRVVSNGLLLKQEMGDLLDIMREHGVGFDISLYPPTKEHAAQISEVCGQAGVKLYVTPEVREFRASMNLAGDSVPEEVFPVCPARHCAFLGSGVISVCAMPQLLPVYNEHFGMDLQVYHKDVISLYDEELTGDALLERLHTPMGTCRYCSAPPRTFPWETADARTAVKEDWEA